jgi:hypothetical protein
MEATAPYRVSVVANAPVTCPLEAAMREVTTRLRLTAAAAGLPDLHMSVKVTVREGLPAFTYVLLATGAGIEWHQAPVQVQGYTLDQAEILFLEALAHKEYLANEADPSRFVAAQIESFQQLEAAA